MKKLFTLLCAAAFVAAAAAQTLPEPKAFDMSKLLKKEINPFNSVRPLESGVASSIAELVGKYNARAYDYQQEDTPVLTFPLTITAGEKENEVLISGIGEIPLPVKATVDFENQYISIENQTLDGVFDAPDGQQYHVRLQHGAWVEDESGNQIYGTTEKPIEGMITDGGILLGYPNDVFQIDLYTRDIYERNWCAISYIPAVKEYEDPFTYEPVNGTATFHDGWVLPGFGYDPEANGREVALERCVENPYQFRLVNPYPQGYLDVNEGTEDPGYIVFDISMPDFVVVFAGYKSGFYENSVWGMGNFYFYDLAGFILADYEAGGQAISAAEIKALMEKGGYACSTLNDREITVRNCVFGYDQNPLAGGIWEINGEAIDMTAKIILPEGLTAITEVSADSSAPTEYFNLQGIKVENPANGLYIRRQGSTTKKVYIK